MVSITCHYKDTVPLGVSLHNKKNKKTNKQIRVMYCAKMKIASIMIMIMISVTQSSELKLDDGTN